MKNLIRKAYHALIRISLCWRFRSINVRLGESCNIHRKETIFEGNNFVGSHTVLRGFIGRYSYVGSHCAINCRIGRYCSIASGVRVIRGTHPTHEWVSTHPAFYSVHTAIGRTYVSSDLFEEYAERQTTVGNDVWIGAHALILDGVQIGDGAIIAAGAVVTKDVPPYSIVGGVPAKLIRKRFSDEEIEKLLKLQWWNKDEAWISAHADSFSCIDDFFEDEY